MASSNSLFWNLGELFMRICRSVLAALTMCGLAGIASAQSLGGGFTYQGTFADNGSPANGSYDFEFVLYTVATAGTAVQTVTKADLPVNGGLINTVIDFGAATYNGAVKWVEVRVRPGTSTGSYTALTPRQALTGAPYALGLPMPFQRTVSTGNTTAFRINAADSGTAIQGIVPTFSGNPAVHGIALGDTGVGLRGDSNGGLAISGVAQGRGTGVRGESVGDGSGGGGFGGDGVRGLSGDGYGVHGVGVIGGWFQGGRSGVIIDGTSGVGDAVLEINDYNDGPVEGNLIHASLLGAIPSTAFRVNRSGFVFANGGYITGGADVAEYVPAAEALGPGDVAEIDAIDGKALRKSSRANSAAVAGVISTLPGLTLNGSMSEHEAQKSMPRLALAGRVPVKTTNENGAIHAGDLLVSASRPGHAMRSPESPLPGTVIGKAMEPLKGDTGVIEMLVMLR
jgi:hypothetical protein